MAEYLQNRLGTPVVFAGDAVGQGGENAVLALHDRGIVVLENTRFHPGETASNPEISATWAALSDLFVNDAFGAAHRDHASTAGLARAVRERGGTIFQRPDAVWRCQPEVRAAMPNARMREMYDRWLQTQPYAADNGLLL